MSLSLCDKLNQEVEDLNRTAVLAEILMSAPLTVRSLFALLAPFVQPNSPQYPLAKGIVDCTRCSSAGKIIASWNIDSLRAHIVDEETSKCKKTRVILPESPMGKLIARVNPDIICLQETKLKDSDIACFNIVGFHTYWNCSTIRKGYSGVAIWSREKPMLVTTELPGAPSELQKEGRIIVAHYPGYIVVNTYTPNTLRADQKPMRGWGRIKEGEKKKKVYDQFVDLRKSWDLALSKYLEKLKERNKNVIWCGDMNVVRSLLDIHNGEMTKVKIDEEKADLNRASRVKILQKRLDDAKKNLKFGISAGLRLEEQAGLRRVLNNGFSDAYRRLYPNSYGFTYWDRRKTNFRKSNNGWRIDYFVVSDNLLPCVESVKVYKDIGVVVGEKVPSDHAPLVLTFYPTGNGVSPGSERPDFLDKFRIAHQTGGDHGASYIDGAGKTLTQKLLRDGRKTGDLHYAWYVFPQIEGLPGYTETSRIYAIKNITEAQEFLKDPILGPHLREYASAVLKLLQRDPLSSFGVLKRILGTVDALKFRSSMTLFLVAAEKNNNVADERLFKTTLLDIGGVDPLTMALLESQSFSPLSMSPAAGDREMKSKKPTASDHSSLLLQNRRSDTKSVLLFEETDLRLESAVSFSQYSLPIRTNLRLVTIIGEQHELEFMCKENGPQITIANYTIKTLNNNPMARVLLEIDPAFVSSKKFWPKSSPIQGILQEALTNPKLLARVRAYDWRNYWIGADPRELLYHNMNKVMGNNKDDLLKIYVYPFTITWKKDNPFDLPKDSYDPEIYQFLTLTFLNNLEATMKNISDQIQTQWDLRIKKKRMAARKDIVTKLQHFWKEVTDWNMLKELFLISEADSIIAIMGEQHRQNLSVFFKKQTLLSEQKGSQGKCVSLFKTAYL